MKSCLCTPGVVSWIVAGSLVLCLNVPAVFSAEAKPIVLGLSAGDADKHNVEFQIYDRMIPVYRDSGIRAAFLEHSFFFHRNCTEDQLLAMLKKFHVVHLATTQEGANPFDEAHKKQAAVVGRALARYVEEGGGLFLQPQLVRYPGMDDEVYWNAVLAPLGVNILHEGVFDKTRAFEGMTLGKATFWHTSNIQPHAVTKGVTSLYLPLHGFVGFPGLPAMRYSPEWTILVRGEADARSYKSGDDNVINLNVEGAYASAPPVLAVRQLGKGRIVSYPVSDLFTGQNHRNPLWADIVESGGDRAAGRPSHSMKMQMNAYRWLAEPSRALADFGTCVQEPYKPIQFPAKVNCDRPFAPAATRDIRGIFGAHTAYSDGNGTVADYVKAAKRAGLSFIVFIPVDTEGTAWFQESIEEKNELWMGNVFVCDNKNVKITLVVDGQADGKPPFVELHNPTDQKIRTMIHSPSRAPLFGGMSAWVKLPPGDSARLKVNGKVFE
jgi:hypothetical protein